MFFHREESITILSPGDSRIFKLMVNINGSAASRVMFFSTGRGEPFHLLNLEFFPKLEFMSQNEGACILATNPSAKFSHK